MMSVRAFYSMQWLRGSTYVLSIMLAMGCCRISKKKKEADKIKFRDYLPAYTHRPLHHAEFYIVELKQEREHFAAVWQ